jgi:hypothetical protein
LEKLPSLFLIRFFAMWCFGTSRPLAFVTHCCLLLVLPGYVSSSLAWLLPAPTLPLTWKLLLCCAAGASLGRQVSCSLHLAALQTTLLLWQVRAAAEGEADCCKGHEQLPGLDISEGNLLKAADI